MDITGYVEHLRTDLMAAAASGGETMVDAAERLATSLDAALRMALLEALSDAAAEITAALDGTTVEVRLRGRDPDLVVTVEAPPTPAGVPLPPPPHRADASGGDRDDAATARITLRIPEPLKQRAEAAAAAARQSLNTWLVDAVRLAADADPAAGGSPAPSGRHGPKHLSGWVR